MSTLSLRINEDEKKLIDAYTNYTGICFSDFARRAIIEYINEELNIDEDRILKAKKNASINDSIPVDEVFESLGV